MAGGQLAELLAAVLPGFDYHPSRSNFELQNVLENFISSVQNIVLKTVVFS
jgi:hypothetical protein